MLQGIVGWTEQRVLLARALCATKKIVLLDEPVSGLDPEMTEEMYRLIWRINQEEKVTVIMISHDLKGVREYASHIMKIGNKPFYGTKEEYLQYQSEIWNTDKSGEER